MTDTTLTLDELKRCPVASFDRMRQHCPVAHAPNRKGWWVYSHAEVRRVITDEHRFSNVVSQHRSVPNGLDQPEHTPFRQLIEPYFDQSHLQAFAPLCQQIAQSLAQSVAGQQAVDVMEMAEQFSVQIQCAFLGWPARLHQPLRRWARDNHAATLTGDTTAMEEIAERFTGYIHELLAERRAHPQQHRNDVTAEIMNATVGEHDTPISDTDIVSIMRNWTMGEIGTIAASVGIMLHFLATQPALQQHLREHREDIPEAVEEMLRRHGPLVTNRRRATQEVTLGEQTIKAGDTVTVNWVAANRDESVFANPDEFQWGRDHSHNLLYGAGLHVCPGAPLARLELQTMLTAVLDYSGEFTLTPHQSPQTAHYPASGYRHLWLDFKAPTP
jgi:cytochrome P450